MEVSRRNVTPSDERFVKDKVTKRRLRREAFLLKIENAVALRNASGALSSESGGGDASGGSFVGTRDLGKSLPLLEELEDVDNVMKDVEKDTEDRREEEAAKRRHQEKLKKKKQLTANAAKDKWERVMKHDAFQQNPLEAVNEHIGNCFQHGVLK